MCCCLAPQSADVGAQARSGDDTCDEHDGEGGQGFQGGVVVDHGEGLSEGLKKSGVVLNWAGSMRIQVTAQLLLQLNLQMLRADDSHMGQPCTHRGPNLVGVGNLA